MSKFNTGRTKPTGTSPVRGETTPTGVTFEGAPGYARDTKSELFLLAVSNMVGEDTFYETAGQRDDRYTHLVRQVALEDPDWLTRFVYWLRTSATMRSAPLVAAAEAAKARTGAGEYGHSRQLVDAAMARADEPGELLAYWTSRYGRTIPKPVKRGVADAVTRLYDERSLLKYDTASHGFRFSDVLELVHPCPNGRAHLAYRGSTALDGAGSAELIREAEARQGDLFEHAIDRRHDRNKPIPASLAVIQRRQTLMEMPVEERRALIEGDADNAARTLRQAGMTWESLAGWLQGPMDARTWEVMAPSMGAMALVRNLRNFDQAGVSDDAAARVAARIADPEQVARSRQLPMRFLAAYRAAPSLRWAWALEQALGHSLANVPVLSGRTLVLVDRSGSMFWSRLSKRSDLTRADAAAVFGAALALRATKADLVEFGTRSQRVRYSTGESALRVLDRFHDMGGTNTADAVRRHYRKHDRVVIVTDEQVWGGHRGQDPTTAVPAEVPVYTWNLAGYRHGHGPSGDGNRHTFGGLSDAAFRMVPLVEAGRRADWPF